MKKVKINIISVKKMKINKNYNELEQKEKDAWFEILDTVISDAFFKEKKITDIIKELSYKYELKIKYNYKPRF